MAHAGQVHKVLTGPRGPICPGPYTLVWVSTPYSWKYGYHGSVGSPTSTDPCHPKWEKLFIHKMLTKW